MQKTKQIRETAAATRAKVQETLFVLGRIQAANDNGSVVVKTAVGK